MEQIYHGTVEQTEKHRENHASANGQKHGVGSGGIRFSLTLFAETACHKGVCAYGRAHGNGVYQHLVRENQRNRRKGAFTYAGNVNAVNNVVGSQHQHGYHHGK